ncbi:MAG: methanogenesis marker protein 11 [Candidatus Geothermincolia bacterium]
MSETFTPEEIRERFGALPYVTPYERIVALVDEATGTVELHEFHARGRCTGGAAWEVHHYEHTSPLVKSARREGARNIFVCREGRAELELVPGVAGAGLEEVRVGPSEVALTYAGLAGGGVAATLCRGMAKGVISTEVHERGGGASLGRATLRVPARRKLTIGVDDTDDSERGATWSLVNELAFALERDGLADYLLHTIVQLFPDNPYKTTNCCATAVVFGCDPGVSGQVVAAVLESLGRESYSNECGAAWTSSVEVPMSLREFSLEAKAGMVSIEDARSAGALAGVELAPVKGERGCIGALAAVGAHDDPDAAVLLDPAG